MAMLSMFFRRYISIHAPTRGATQDCTSYLSSILFQSTLLQEERRCTMHDRFLLIYFNPRSYKRSDWCPTLGKDVKNDFNPRSYKRSDGKNAQLSLYLSVIIIA